MTWVLLGSYTQWRVDEGSPMSILRRAKHEKPSWEKTIPYSRCWTTWCSCGGHPASISKDQTSNRHVIVLTGCYMKLKVAIQVTTVTWTSAATAFVYNCVISYGILTHLLTSSRPLFVSKFLAAVTVCLCIEHMKTTTYDPQTNRQVQSFNQTIVMHCQHYIAEH